MTKTDYQVGVDGVDPDSMFVQPPDADAVKKALEDAAQVSACGCEPRKCRSVRIAGIVDSSEQSQVAKDVKKAYLEANPGVNDTAIDVEIKEVKSNLVDADG